MVHGQQRHVKNYRYVQGTKDNTEGLMLHLHCNKEKKKVQM